MTWSAKHPAPVQYPDVDRQVVPSGQLPPSGPQLSAQVPPRTQVWSEGQGTVRSQAVAEPEPQPTAPNAAASTA